MLFNISVSIVTLTTLSQKSHRNRRLINKILQMFRSPVINKSLLINNSCVYCSCGRLKSWVLCYFSRRTFRRRPTPNPSSPSSSVSVARCEAASSHESVSRRFLVSHSKRQPRGLSCTLSLRGFTIEGLWDSALRSFSVIVVNGLVLSLMCLISQVHWCIKAQMRWFNVSGGSSVMIDFG